MSEDNHQKLLEFAHVCDAVRKKLYFSTTALTPLNFEEEKEKFFNSSTYNPIFHYRSFNFQPTDALIKELKIRLKELKLPREIKHYLNEYIQDLHLLEKTKQSIGSDDFGFYAHQLFRFHEMREFRSSLHYPSCLENEPKAQKLFNAYEIAEAFRNALHQRYGLTKFAVFVETNKANIIWTGVNSIHIGQAIKRYDKNVRRLIVHEIESHALQYYNLSLYDTPLIKLSKYREHNLYSEGLAVYNEVQTGTITRKAYEDYWYRLRAVQMIDGSFREIFDYLRENLPEKRAFQITYRVKRGMHHTERPGGFPKDASYFLGYKTVENHIKSGLHHDFLYISKSPSLTALLLSHGLLDSADIQLPKFKYKVISQPSYSQASSISV